MTKKAIDELRHRGLSWVKIAKELNTTLYSVDKWRADNNYQVISQLMNCNQACVIMMMLDHLSNIMQPATSYIAELNKHERHSHLN